MKKLKAKTLKASFNSYKYIFSGLLFMNVAVVHGVCDLGSGDIGGTIFRDFNQNGSQDILEPGFGVVGMVVTAYNSANVVIGTSVVDANGLYEFNGISGSDYRLELSGLPDYLQFGAAGVESDSSVRFENAATCSANFTVNNPVDYCQVDPDFIMSRFTLEERGGTNSAINTILEYNNLDNGTDAPTNLVAYANIGSTYGLAYLRKANVSYASTFFKRHADIGPAGIGGIYKIDHNAGNAVSTFATLPGIDPRGGAGGGYDWDHDTISYVNVGKRAIGDIELSDDESQLFAVNMEDRNLYTMDIDANGNIIGAASNVAIPNPCSNVLDYRPMGLGYNDGVLYVGVTCTSESSVDPSNVDTSTNGPRKGDKALLSSHIYSYNSALGTFSATPVLDIDLTYDRGCIYDNTISVTAPSTCTYIDWAGATEPYRSNWNPWQMDYDIVFNDKIPGNIGNQNGWVEYMQPLLSDIEFDNDGSMIVAIRDINGDRGGHQKVSPNPADLTLQNQNGEGDILRACGNATTGWTLESNGTCGGVTSGGAGNDEGPGGGEFYWYDNGPGGNGNVSGGTNGHADTAMGGLLQIPGQPDFVTGVMDVHGFLDNGLVWLRNDNGQISVDGGFVPKRLFVSGVSTTQFFGKGNGIGDLEALCDPSPLEVGNSVWSDTDGDGIQDAGEVGIDGITVTLSCGIDSVSTVTANGGKYYFSNAVTVNAGTTQALFMDSGESCQLSLINNVGGLFASTPSPQNADADLTNNSETDVRDSDASNVGTTSSINITLGASGHDNHSYDFGFEPLDGELATSVGSTVFNDTDNSGTLNGAEVGISGVTVQLYSPGVDGVIGGIDDVLLITTTTDVFGNYYIGGLPADDYFLRIPTSNFGFGNPLAGTPLSSTTTNTNDDQTDNDDNGSQVSSGLVTDSPVFTLTVNGEPLAAFETGLGGTADDVDDDNGDMTIDFGFVSTDFGDAPNGYGTNLVSGAQHVIVPDLVIGLTIDAEEDGQASVGATGDGADEDGVTIPALSDLQTLTLNPVITNNTGSAATVVCWIDYDGNGLFDNAESGSSSVSTGNTLASIAVVMPDVPPTASTDTSGSTFARCRLSTDTFNGTNPTGLLTDGEVEDYAVTIVEAVDFGDAPDTGLGTGIGDYRTTLADNGPSHSIDVNIFMGATYPDGETDGQPNTLATGDNNNNLSDEDGPQTVLNFASGATPSIQVLVTNQTGSNADLTGWIDYNGNGVFENGTERTILVVPTGTIASLVTLTMPVVPGGVPADSIFRVRFSTDVASQNSTGAVTDGEVEDHRITFNQPTSGDPQLCYAVADGGNWLITVDPISGVIDDLAAGLGSISPYTSVETIAWGLGDPIVSGDETLYAFNSNELVQLLPTPRAIIGTLNHGITDADGMAVDWQSNPPVFYGSGGISGASNLRRIFTFDSATANVTSRSATIALPNSRNHIDDIAWDAINRRLIGVTNSGGGRAHIVEFDITNLTSGLYGAAVTAHNCGRIRRNGTQNLRDVEGLTFSSTGEIFLTTGDGGVAATNNSLYKIEASAINADCIGTASAIIETIRIAPTVDLDLSTIPSGSGSSTLDHEAVDCGLSFTQSDASIGNRVWLDEDGDGDQDAGEDGIGGVTVYLCRSNAAPCDASSAVLTDVTDANGGYLFSNIPIMDYILAVETSTLPTDLMANPTYDEDDGTVSPDHQTVVSLNIVEEEHLTADFGYNWNSSPQTGTPPPGSIGSIGDRIWIDSDGDGIQDSNESGINLVTVNLYTDPDFDGVFDNLVGTTTTDENGNYNFDGLTAGAYAVEVDPSTLPAGVTWTQTGDPDEFGQTATAADDKTTAPIILAPGDVYVNADFGYRGNAASTHDIGDTIYFDADANGAQNVGENGIPNITVSLLDASGTPIAFTTTDSNGNYLFSGLPDGTYTVEVTDTNNILAPLEQSADPDVTFDNSSTITLFGSDNLNQDFGYTPRNHSVGLGLIGDTIYIDTNASGAQDAGEPGIEGVTVELSNGAGLYARTVTDENGSYSFGGLPAGTYSVQVVTSTLPNGGTGLTNSDDPDGGADSLSSGVVIAGNENLTQDFGYNVTTPNTIGGTLWNDNDADGTQDAGETTIFVGVTVDLLDANGNIVGSTVTDGSGNYQFTGLPDGTYTVVITDNSNNLAGHWLTEGSNPGTNLNSQVVGYTMTVAGGSTNQTGDFGYYVNLASIGNIVYRDDNNNGVRDIGTEPGIPLVPVTLTITYPNGDIVTLTTLTDDAGFYTFERLLADDSYTGDVADGPQPTYSVGAVAIGLITTYDGTPDTSGIGLGTNDNSDNDSGEGAFPVKGSQDLTNDFGFIFGATIGNRVWLDLDGDGVQDANEDGIANRIVELTPPAGVDIGAGPGNPITTVTDTDGKYIFTNLPLENGYTVTVTNPPGGYTQTFDEDGTGTAHTSTVNLTVSGEEHLTADFGYNVPSGSVGDYVWSDANGDGQQDPGEVGIDNVTVYLCTEPNLSPCNAATPGVQTTTTDANGLYLFTGLSTSVVFVVQVDTTTLPAGYNQTGDPDGVGAPDDQTTVLALSTTGNVNIDADFGYQPPAAGHSDIGDTIYKDIDGDGTDDGGTDPGIIGVTLQLFVDTTADGVPDTPIASVITDVNGEYLFPSLPNGKAYSVKVTDTSNILNDYVQTADPDVSLDDQSTIAILTTDDLNQDFGYRPSRIGVGVIGDRIFHDVNANALQDVGDQGLEGVTVRLFDTSGNLIDSVVTDENGNYLFTALNQLSTYTVVVVTSTLPNGGAGWTNNIDPQGLVDSQSIVDLSLIPSGIVLDQDFGYTGSGNTIEGTVWSDNDGNGLLTDGTGGDPDETPNGLENVTVVLKDASGNIVATTTTDANGDYSFSGLADGTYSVMVTDDNNELANLQHTDGPNANDNAIDDNSQDDTGYAVSVTGGATNTTADFGYQPVVTTPITLASFKASYNQATGETTIKWSTLTETGNVGFDIFRQIDGIWEQVNEYMIASKRIYSTDLVSYEFTFEGDYTKEWAIVDVDIMGKRQSHGVYSINIQYGEEVELEKTQLSIWNNIQQVHQEKSNLRNYKKAMDINKYINKQKRTTINKTGEGL